MIKLVNVIARFIRAIHRNQKWITRINRVMTGLSFSEILRFCGSIVPKFRQSVIPLVRDSALKRTGSCKDGSKAADIRILAVVIRQCLIAGMAFLWLAMPAPAHAQCVNPAGSEGEVIFNETHNIPQYCDATNWIAMAAGEDGGLPCTTDLVRACSMTSSFNCTGTVIQTAALGSVGACEAQCETWGETNTGSCCEYTAGGTCNFKDGTLNFNAGDNAALCGDQINYNVVSTEGSGIYCVYVQNGSDWYSICGGDGVGNETCSTIASPGDTVCVHGNTPTSDITFKVNGAGVSTDFGSSGTHNGVTYDAYEGDGSGGAYCTASNTTQIVPGGLVGHWRLDETSGTVAADSSGNGNDGTMQGGLDPSTDSVGGPVGAALSFDGTDDYIGFGDLADMEFPGQHTYIFWFKPQDTVNDSNGDFLIGKEDSFVGSAVVWDWQSTAGRFGFLTNSLTFTWGDTNKSLGQWYHVAAVYDGTNALLYVNGQLENSAAVSYSANTSTNFNIGAWSGGPDRYSLSEMDDVRAYNRALDAAEILEIYQARDGIRYNNAHRVPEYFDGNKFVPMVPQFENLTSGLVGHWKLDETTGTTAVDSTGNSGNNGDMINGLDAANDSAPGAVGTALSFDGVEQYIEITGTDMPTGSGVPFTISLWASAPTTDNLDGVLFLFGRDNDASYLRPNLKLFGSGTIYLRVGVGNNISNDFLLSGFEANRLYHYTVTYDGTDVTAYSNATSLGTWTPASPIEPVDTVGYIGARLNSGSASRFHMGVIDDVRLYDRVLSQTEIQSLYAMGAPVGSSTALPQGCPSIGDVCDDGSIYAGLSPDGNVEMFTTPADASSLYTWNDGTTNYTDMSMANCTDTSPGTAATCQTGEANTVFLVGAGGEPDYPFAAAAYCYGLSAHGYDDWYLPAQDELNVLYTNKNTGALNGTFNETGSFPAGSYWSSSEDANNAARLQSFSSGFQSNGGKVGGLAVRCVRKGPAPRCANPYGLEGSMIYNTTHNIVQYCDGARWLAIGKRN